MKKAILFIAFCFLIYDTTSHNKPINKITVERDLFNEAVELIIQKEGWHDDSHYPYIGYGHRITKKDSFRYPISKKFARKLVESDLKAKCSVFRSFGKDSLLLGVLAYNVGETSVNSSSIIKKLDRNNRNIKKEYLSFCYIGNRKVKSILERRKTEYELLFNKTKTVTLNGKYKNWR